MIFLVCGVCDRNYMHERLFQCFFIHLSQIFGAICAYLFTHSTSICKASSSYHCALSETMMEGKTKQNTKIPASCS